MRRCAQRRIDPSHARDVVVEAFLVAWRRLNEAPRAVAGPGGGDGPAAPAPPLGQITQDTITQFGGHNLASLVDGAVGADVAAVTIRASGRLVKATVRDGRFAAWWPGKGFADGPSQPSSGGGPRLNLRHDVTLTDGTTYSSTEFASGVSTPAFRGPLRSTPRPKTDTPLSRGLRSQQPVLVPRTTKNTD